MVVLLLFIALIFVFYHISQRIWPYTFHLSLRLWSFLLWGPHLPHSEAQRRGFISRHCVQYVSYFLHPVSHHFFCLRVMTNFLFLYIYELGVDANAIRILCSMISVIRRSWFRRKVWIVMLWCTFFVMVLSVACLLITKTDIFRSNLSSLCLS